MGVLDKNFDIQITLKDSKMKSPSMEVYTSDVGIFNMLITLKDMNGSIIKATDLANYTVKAYIVKPDNTYKPLTATTVSGKDKLQIEIPSTLSNTQGVYKFEFTITRDSETITTNSATYSVKVPNFSGLVEASSMSIMSAKSLSPYDTCMNKINEIETTAISDVRFDGKKLSLLARDEEVKREIYLDKLQQVEFGKGVKKVKNKIVVDEKYIQKLIEKEIEKILNK